MYVNRFCAVPFQIPMQIFLSCIYVLFTNTLSIPLMSEVHAVPRETDLYGKTNSGHVLTSQSIFVCIYVCMYVGR